MSDPPAAIPMAAGGSLPSVGVKTMTATDHANEPAHPHPTSPVDIGGDVASQRPLFEELFGGFPLPDRVTYSQCTLASVPALVADAPETDQNTIVLYLHGGAYALGSPRTGLSLACALARRIRARAYSIGYRLAPEHAHPAALQDALAAYRWLLDNGIDNGRVLIAGDSAGGGLTLATLAAARDQGLPLPAAAALFSPWTDLSLSGASIQDKAADDPILNPEGLRRRAREYLGGLSPEDPLASPLFADLSGLPPLQIHVGSHEVLLNDATRIASRAACQDVHVELQAWPRMPHVFPSREHQLPQADAALDAAGAFAARHLRGRANPPAAGQDQPESGSLTQQSR
jgi:epsilon-lactone hydrolase